MDTILNLQMKKHYLFRNTRLPFFFGYLTKLRITKQEGYGYDYSSVVQPLPSIPKAWIANLSIIRFFLTNLSLPYLCSDYKPVSSHAHHEVHAAAPSQMSTGGWRHGSWWQRMVNICKVPILTYKGKKAQKQNFNQASLLICPNYGSYQQTTL